MNATAGADHVVPDRPMTPFPGGPLIPDDGDDHDEEGDDGVSGDDHEREAGVRTHVAGGSIATVKRKQRHAEEAPRRLASASPEQRADVFDEQDTPPSQSPDSSTSVSQETITPSASEDEGHDEHDEHINGDAHLRHHAGRSIRPIGPRHGSLTPTPGERLKNKDSVALSTLRRLERNGDASATFVSPAMQLMRRADAATKQAPTPVDEELAKLTAARERAVAGAAAGADDAGACSSSDNELGDWDAM